MQVSLIVLGTGSAIESADRDNTALALRADRSAVLIDCPGSAALKLRRAGIDPLNLAAVVLTHGHADHIYGLPSLVHNLWLLDRTAPLPVFATEPDLPRLQRLVDIFDPERRAGFLDWRPLMDGGSAPFYEWTGGRLFAHPVDHGPPACAIRWDTPVGARIVYSSDTRPVEALAAFGRGATLFVHEATFIDAGRAKHDGHSTPEQAGKVAALAAARRLLLVHLGLDADPGRWVAEARKTFAGPVEVPADGTVYALT
ncbi:MAG: MBL fold metallo-hydrolase [Armatimonadetes bacterium]|nr:MBL fold metallo-hydrolase [Armatimonadota bacterium]